ncbi:hypothetical protein D5018_03495 [Parashewanella curva]|uniref:Uncharacterized protein n=1 Tax=Parashewanella curva TaxID=2338552 RepID=A0A3L8Q0I1_9GAMM|nr:hypothetical protein [Parashewanella curva]RLV61075.1 hypothetical protein D5018_03495 [Parashewanella curva]
MIVRPLNHPLSCDSIRGSSSINCFDKKIQTKPLFQTAFSARNKCKEEFGPKWDIHDKLVKNLHEAWMIEVDKIPLVVDQAWLSVRYRVRDRLPKAESVRLYRQQVWLRAREIQNQKQRKFINRLLPKQIN